MATLIQILQREKSQRTEGAIRFTVNSASDARKHYIVQKAGKQWQCSCKHWIFSRAKCKHIKAVEGKVQ